MVGRTLDTYIRMLTEPSKGKCGSQRGKDAKNKHRRQIVGV